MPHRHPTPNALVTALAVCLIAASCSGGGDADPGVAPLTIPDPAPVVTTDAGASTATTDPGLPVGPGATIERLEDAYAAVVRIESTGTFVHPVGLDLPASDPVAGSGSGFSIGDNVVVTVAQAVVGATAIAVTVPGEPTARQGTVLGVDECGGVALVRVDGDPLPVLRWYDDDRVRDGLAVHSAGYASVDNEFADAGEFVQAGGYVENETTSAATSWADPGLLVTYGAPAYPGMHGGPLLDANGRVVAVIGARDRGAFAAMNNGLFAGFVVPIVQRLLSGDDSTAGAGINLQAIETDTGLAGVWVTAVHPDSLAARSGIMAGDLITRFGDTGAFVTGSVDVDGYCRTLRNAGDGVGVTIDVARYATGDRYTGRLGTAMRQTLTGRGAPGAPYAWIGDDEYAALPTDEFGHIALDLPVAWNARRTAPVAVDQLSASFLLATVDVDDFEAGVRTTPGVRVRSTAAYRSSVVDSGDLLARVADAAGVDTDCATVIDVDPAAVAATNGVQRVVEYRDCGGRDTRYTIAVGQDDGGGFTIEVQTVHDAMHPLALELVRRAVINGRP